MDLIGDFVAGLLEQMLHRVYERKTALYMALMTLALLGFVLYAAVLLGQGYPGKGAVLLLFAALSAWLLAAGLKKQRKQ